MTSNGRSEALIQEIADLFARRGREMYAGEPVTQTEHALQAALQAEESGADAALITAAFLHDVGHLLHDLDEDCAEDGIDDKHEALGAEWLSQHFGFEVVEPVRLHVAAKRYLCAVDEDVFRSTVSDASRLSSAIAGGPVHDRAGDASSRNIRASPLPSSSAAGTNKPRSRNSQRRRSNTISTTLEP